MKLIAALLLVFAVGLLLASSARADKPVGLTCGGSVTKISALYDAASHTWVEGDIHYCGKAKTYSWEIQYRRSGTWYDWSPEHIVASGDCSTGCRFHGRDTGALCSTHADAYRVRSWWADGRRTTTARSAAYACSGGVI